MDPLKVACLHEDCPANGKAGLGNVRVHSREHQRYRCTACRKTFSATKWTPLFHLHHDHALFLTACTLLAHGCPVQAIVAAYGLDERTVSDWLTRAAEPLLGVQRRLVQRPRDLQHVQADEIRVRAVGGVFWMAMARAVPTRLWLGGFVSPDRDLSLVRKVAGLVRRCWDGRGRLLACVDGLAGYVKAFREAFRSPLRTGRPGRPRLVVSALLWVGRVIKEKKGGVIGVRREGVFGEPSAMGEWVRRTGTGNGLPQGKWTVS